MSVVTKLDVAFSVILRWLPTYLLNRFRGCERPVHVLFCTVDHYEPGTGAVSAAVEKDRVVRLQDKYPRLVEGHSDHAGNPPKRTWFFPPHYHRYGNLERLVRLCEMGLGEIELHLHHGKKRPDTAYNLRRTIEKSIEEYSRFGIFGDENGRKRYGFIHGDWALDNSRKGKFCGVNNEIEILRDTGCYADFTFPSLNESNPDKINTIYYAVDNARKSKSYNRGIPVKREGKQRGDLIIVQGPLHFQLSRRSRFGVRLMGDAISGSPVSDRKRVDLWVKTGIHVKGQRNWVFIKTHTHGATDEEAVLGKEMEQIFSHLEQRYNDGMSYILHYVTAREMFNIIKALESGEREADPECFRDYLVSSPGYDSSAGFAEASDELKDLIGYSY